MTDNYMNFADFNNEDKIYSPGYGYVDRGSARYVSALKKREIQLNMCSASCMPKPIVLPPDETDNKINELDNRISKADENINKLEEESSESLKELKETNKTVQKLEQEVEDHRSNILKYEAELKALKNETEDQKFKRTVNERNEYEQYKKKYDEIKKEYDNCIIPTNIPEPKRNASKIEKDQYTQKLQEKESLRIKKNQLSNQLRNREVDLEKATEKLNYVMNNATEIIQKKIKEERVMFDSKCPELNKLRSKQRSFQVLQSKLDIAEKELNEAKEAKRRYELRGMTVISKTGVINYDNNGYVIPKKPSYDKMFQEIKELENNPPTKVERNTNIIVEHEYNYLTGYLVRLTEQIDSQKNKFGFVTEQSDYVKDGLKEIAEVKNKINELKKNLYLEGSWNEVDHDKLYEMKEDIYRKYKYIPREYEEVVEKRKYTIDDFLRSIGR